MSEFRKEPLVILEWARQERVSLLRRLFERVIDAGYLIVIVNTNVRLRDLFMLRTVRRWDRGYTWAVARDSCGNYPDRGGPPESRN